MDRIATYLDEEEVDGQVSTLKRSDAELAEDAIKALGIERGTFRWNEVQQPKDDKAKKPSSTSATNGSHADDDAVTVVDSASIAGSESDRRFELTDINVMFPDGELSVVTGPTASGKTALLVRRVFLHGKGERVADGSLRAVDGSPRRNDAH